MVKDRVAIIPARGGSKRIPKKNIKSFMGKPMIAWTIEAAINANIFDLVLVSTDCEEIANIAVSYGAKVPFLRNDHADDASTISQATITCLTQLKNFNNKNYKTVVQLMANCPLRTKGLIIEQVNAYENLSTIDSLLSGFNYGMFNPWWAHFKNKTQNFERLLTNFEAETRSQDLPELICPSGATWISDVDRLNFYGTFYSKGYKFHKISWLNAVDIDDLDDLLLAKAAYQILNEKG